MHALDRPGERALVGRRLPRADAGGTRTVQRVTDVADSYPPGPRRDLRARVRMGGTVVNTRNGSTSTTGCGKVRAIIIAVQLSVATAMHVVLLRFSED